MPKLKIAVPEDAGRLVREAAVRGGVSVERVIVDALEIALEADELFVPEAEGSLSVSFRPRVSSELRDRVRTKAERRGWSVNGFCRAALVSVQVRESQAEQVEVREEMRRAHERVRARVGPEPPQMPQPGPDAPTMPQPHRIEPFEHAKRDPSPKPVWTDGERRSSGYPPHAFVRPNRLSGRARLATFYSSLGRSRGDVRPLATVESLEPKFYSARPADPYPSLGPYRRTRLTLEDGTEI